MIKYNVNITVKSSEKDEEVKNKLLKGFEKVYGFKLTENKKDLTIKKGNFFAMGSKEENEISSILKEFNFSKIEIKKVNEKKPSEKIEKKAE